MTTPISAMSQTITAEVAAYIAGALDRPLPPAAHAAGVAHTLDTIASIVAGAGMPVGPIAIRHVEMLGGREEATVIGSSFRSNPVNAALANGIMAHADETDDSHGPSITHPGCGVVPAAFAVAEKYGRSGEELIRGVVCGYDIGIRLSLALGGGRFFDHYRMSSHSFGGYFGAVGAAAALARLTPKQAEYALAYCVQLVSGIPCWYRDPDHMEKAFNFGGMPAKGGTEAALMAASGFSGSALPLEGNPGLFTVWPEKCDPTLMTRGLGEVFEVERTTIKKWSVGSPIQGALDSLQALMHEHGFAAAQVEKIHIILPPRRALAIDNRNMPAVNIQHQLSLLLIDGNVTFVSGHDEARMHNDPAVAEMRRRITVEGDPAQPEGGTAHVHVTLRDGRALYRHTAFVRGTPQNPMGFAEVAEKARDIMLTSPLTEVERILDALTNIADLRDVRDLGALLRTAP
jgi:2-methylcitrate dehydratase PrpD